MQKRFIPVLLCLSLSAFLLSCASTEKIYYAAPSVVPHTVPAMKTAGFWVNLHPSPDQVILTPREIVVFNERTRRDLKLIKDITQIPLKYPGENLRSILNDSLAHEKKRKLFEENGRPAGSVFYAEILRNMNLDAIPVQINLRYGLIIHYADQRVFPTSQGLYAEKGDLDFDELQNSTLDIGTPVVILHESGDREWKYVQSSLSSGWVRAQEVGESSIDDVRHFLSVDKFVVATKAKADIFLDPQMTRHYGYVRMGTRFHLIDEGKDFYGILLPVMDAGNAELKTGYIGKRDVHEGYLAYTPRNIIRQAFELLNAPYGWGGMYGEQDCSAFLVQIFATVGIEFPRNSSAQAKIGESLEEFTEQTPVAEKLRAIQTAPAGMTILPLKGHIMLYLGMLRGVDRPYVIHATWGYREPVAGKDRVRVLNRVVVSDLELGKGSQKGSLLERVKAVKIVK